MKECKPKIKETIIVEGKDDVSAIKKAVIADVIKTNGFGLNNEILEKIKFAYENNGIIIFTDPDYAGVQIRKKLLELFPKSKEAFLSQKKATKINRGCGIENASQEDILDALSKLYENHNEDVGKGKNQFTNQFLVEIGLAGHTNSAMLRDKVGEYLGFGYQNSKNFIKKINTYNITEEDLIKICNELGKSK